MDNIFMKHALKYIEEGFYVFPLKPKSKVPLTMNGFKDASNDPEQINRWWTEWPNANLGIATGEISNLWVVDIDGELPDDLPKFHETRTVKTKKGYHLYYEYNKFFRLPSKTRLCGYPIDIRSDGAYIVAPPSIHPDRGAYEDVDFPFK
ncbi:MAG: bifunctional DNA primase/polymerase [Bdellovibrionales bacterium]